MIRKSKVQRNGGSVQVAKASSSAAAAAVAVAVAVGVGQKLPVQIAEATA